MAEPDEDGGGVVAKIKDSKHRNLILIGLTFAGVLIAYLTYRRMQAGNAAAAAAPATTSTTSGGDPFAGAGFNGGQPFGQPGAQGPAGPAGNTKWLQNQINELRYVINHHGKPPPLPGAPKPKPKPPVKTPGAGPPPPKGKTAAELADAGHVSTHAPAHAVTSHPGGVQHLRVA